MSDNIPTPEATLPVADPVVAAAMAVLDDHFAALNSRDEAGVVATLHFPHYRLSGGVMRVWERPERYLADFFARVGEDWHIARGTFAT